MLTHFTKRKISSSRSVLYFWIFSYFVVLLIMFVTVTITYQRSLVMLEAQVSDMNENALVSIQRDIDNKLKEREAVFRGIVFSESFSTLLNAQTPEPQTQYAVYQLWNNLKTIMSPYNSLFSCYISLPHIRTVISYDSSVYYENLYEGIIIDYGISFEQYMALMLNTYSNKYILLDSSHNNGQPIICFAHTVQFDKTNGYSANILFFFFADEIVADISAPSGLTKKDSLMIVSESGDRLILGQAIDISDADIMEIPSDGRMRIVDTEADKLCVSMRPSAVSSLRYFIVAPYRAIFEQVASIKRFSFIGISLGIVLSIACIYFSLRKNYRPIKSMMGSIHYLPGNSDYRNEMEMIQHAIEELQQQNYEQTGLIDEQVRLLDDNALRERLLGQQGARLSEAALVLTTRYHLALIACEAISGLESDAVGLQPFSKIIITQLLTEPMQECEYLSVFHIENMLAIAMSQSAHDMKNVYSTFRKIAIILQQYYDTTAFIALSGLRNDFENIAYVYALLKDHIMYNQNIGDTSIFQLQNSQDEFSRYYNYPTQVEHRLLNRIQLGDDTHALAVLNEVFDYNMHHNRISFEAVRGLAFAVLGTMISAVSASKQEDVDALIRDTDPYGRLAACTDAIALRHKIVDICLMFCEFTAQTWKLQEMDGGGDLAMKINRFIAESIADQGLNLTMIADHFGLSAPYLSTLYSSAAGIRLVDFINTARIEEVKRLLAASGLSVEKIAVRTGYSGAKTMTRVFKKYEGITPGQYREICKKNEE